MAVYKRQEHQWRACSHGADGREHLFQLFLRVEVVVPCLLARAEPVGIASVQSEISNVAGDSRDQGQEVAKLRLVDGDIAEVFLPEERQGILIVPTLVTELDG